MCRLIESVKVLDGKIYNLEYHVRRMTESCKALFGLSTAIDLEKHLNVPAYARQGLFKCRILYSRSLEHMEYVAYKRQDIQTLKVVRCETIDYSYKYEDRHQINVLFADRGTCDDILIVKKGNLTDTSYGNIIFFDGKRWYTPLHPLLPGTQRQRLLEEKVISTAEIREQDIFSFTHFRIINALNDFWAAPSLPVQCILY